MLGALKEQPADKILMLSKMFREDTRDAKIDLGVGVYRNADGVTPIMRAVKAAEKQLWSDETTKAYTGLAGDPAFSAAMADLVLGDSVDRARLSAVATPGGTGAVRQAFELVKMANPGATIWVSDPTWPNHLSILKHMGMPVKLYRYFDSETRAVDFTGMIADLSQAGAGDVVLLHGCCHNPTGANLTGPKWKAVIDLMQERDLTPMIDIAYQGFGDGLEADAAGVRMVASAMPETLIAASCSKNFGIYRERTGCLMAVSASEKASGVTQSTLAYLNRQNYSFPPDHGARLVTMVLKDPKLRADWETELEEMRTGMIALRVALAEALRDRTKSDRFGFIAEHRGMFSLLGASPAEVERLRVEHGIYIVGDSRINIAGLNHNTVPILADAMVTSGL